MDYNDIIIEPIITEKTTELRKQNKYVFKVHKKANKPEIKKAIERIFGVKVKKVNIMNVKPKVKAGFKYRRGKWEPSWKKAIVTLKEGKINI